MKSLLEREIKLAPPQDLDLASLGGERAGARTLGATYYDTDGGDVVAAFDELEVELVDGGEKDLRRLRAFRAPAPTCSIPTRRTTCARSSWGWAARSATCATRTS